MELYNIVFSPTGTSAKVAEAIVSGIGNALWPKEPGVKLCDVTRWEDMTVCVERSDFAVIVAPVYGGKMAPIAKERMKNIKGDVTPCIVIAVYGNRAFENAVSDMAAFAESLGFVPVAAGAFVGEHSYSTAEKSVANFKAFVKSYMESQQAAPVRILPEVNEDLCSDCGECVAVCPTAAINPESHAADPGKCIKCCACVKICPAGARTLSSPFAPVLSENFSAYKTPQWIVG